jgi:hypothetical protein
MPATDSDTLPSAVEHPAISSSVTMPISLYRLNDRMIGDTVRSTKVTEYPYLFQKRTELTGTFREAATLPDYYHARMFSHLDKRWRLIAQTFHPWDDEHTLTLQHSNVLDGSASYVITTNAQNTSLEGYNDIVNAGVSFNHLLTAIAGYAVTSVSITMGGTDITSTAYNSTTGQISIASVTGNVVIAVAVARPYDAKVNHLQSDGTAYINTGIKASSNIKVDADIKVLSTFTGDSCAIFGSRIANNNTALTLQYYKTSSGTSKYWRWCFGNNGNTANHDGTMGDFHLSSISAANTMVITGAGSYTATCTSSSFSNNYDIYIFGMNNGGEHGGKGALANIQVNAFKIYNGSSLVRDYIPVRKDNVGYLYDKVSGQLFGNSASSGAFTFGNDVTT